MEVDFDLALDLQEPIFPIKGPLLDLFISTVALVDHPLTVLLQLRESHFFLFLGIKQASFEALKVDLSCSRMDLLLDLIHLLFHPAEPIIQCLFHFGGVYAAILDNLSALDYIRALEGG